MQQHVRIAVPREPGFVWQLDATQDEIARLIAAVDVVTDAYAHGSASR
jgi:hypothetical protein